MAVKLIDPLSALATPQEALTEDRQHHHELSAAQVARASVVPPTARPSHLLASTSLTPTKSLEQAAKEDFRVFLTLIWRHLLNVDPNPIQLDMAWWLQHGPDRAIIMAFRGFSKSWITGAYALWRLFCDPDEKVLVVSGSLKRAIATTNWCLQLIMTMPLLKALKPQPSYRQSSQMFDVGNCIPAQSASFMAAGIGGQLVGFRGTCIIPDDVETQTNSLTVVMQEKIEEAVKEFESVLTPGGVIKYLGTPHTVLSLYMKLLRLKDKHGKPVYVARVWPALYPSEEQLKGYGDRLAPYIPSQIRKLGPSCVGHSVMPMRFTDEDLEQRRAAMGNTEFLLQFMLDLTGSFIDKYPLKLSDLTVMDLDDKTGPEEVVWGNTHIERDLPVMGFDGDFYHGPSFVGPTFVPYQKVIGYVDNAGRGSAGSDETSLSIGGALFGRVFWLYLWAATDGFGKTTLTAIAKACVRFRVHTLFVEANYGDGMFVALLGPVLVAEWALANERDRLAAKQLGRREYVSGGTALEEVKSGKAQKEARMLSVLEPVTQQHRLVVSRKVIEWDQQSMQAMEGEDTRHRYAWGYQYTHVTRERDCLGKDDRLESLSGMLGQFADVLGVDPLGMAVRARTEREEDELEKLFADAEEAVLRPSRGRKDGRAEASRPQRR